MPAARFTKAEITRAFEAVKATGQSVNVCEIAPDGTIRLMVGNSAPDMHNGAQPIDLVTWSKR